MGRLTARGTPKVGRIYVHDGVVVVEQRSEAQTIPVPTPLSRRRFG